MITRLMGKKSWISSIINEQFGLFFIILNHLITAEEISHWLTRIEDAICLFIRSKIVLLTLLISDFDGLISLNDGLCGKHILWMITIRRKITVHCPAIKTIDIKVRYVFFRFYGIIIFHVFVICFIVSLSDVRNSTS